MLSLAAAAPAVAGRCRPASLSRRGSSTRLAAPARAPRPALARRAARASAADKERAAAEGSTVGEGSSDFSALASQVAGQLAEEFATPEALDKVSAWLTGGRDEEGQVPPRTDQTTAESDTKKLMRLAAEKFGVPTTLGEAADTVKSWLTGPSAAHSEGSGDTAMVARLVHRLLERYEAEEGEEFHGRDEGQYERLYGLARAALGFSLSKRMLTRLVRSYLGI